MAVDVTPLGFKKPDGATELVKHGAEMISDNAQKAQELIADLRDRRLGNIDGGSPGSTFEDGGNP